jgi:hypothetical protein
MIVPRGIVGVMRMILVILAAARFDRDFDFVVTGSLDCEQDASNRLRRRSALAVEPSRCPVRRGPVCGIGWREGWSWMCQPQREPPIRTGVAIDEVPKRVRNVVTIDIAAALDFEGDIS